MAASDQTALAALDPLVVIHPGPVRGCFVNFTGGRDVRLDVGDRAVCAIREAMSPEAILVFNVVPDETRQDGHSVTVIVTD